MSKENEQKNKNAICVKNISKEFIIPHERVNTLKSAFINLFNKKTYDSFYALKDVSFEVKKGEFFGILGRNGSGKSTLLKILAGVYSLDNGFLEINGLVSPFLELGIGFNPELSGRDNIYLNATVLGLCKKEIDEKFDSIVAFSELERFIDQKIKKYSSGMQVRLAFSVAIHANREILLMDEVLAVGDANFQIKCINEFEKYKASGKTVILVSHDIASIERYCDRAMILENGEIKKIGVAKEVVDEYKKINSLVQEVVIDKIIDTNLNSNIDHLKLNELLKIKEQENKNLHKIINSKNQEIAFMKASKFWKMKEIYEKLKSIFRSKKNISNKDYDIWIYNNENLNISEIKKEINNLNYRPKISIITPVYNVEPRWLDKCINSVLNQYYENWELCLYDDASTNKDTLKCLKKWEDFDPRIKILFGKENKNISLASNEALKIATGEFIALLDNDDELSLNAFYENIKVLNINKDIDFIYSDEDKLELNGKRSDPFFKPDWSIDLLLSEMYTCHLSLYRKSIIDNIGGFRKGFEGSQDYDLVLRFIEKTNSSKIFHISKILYHWRKVVGSTAGSINAKSYANEAAKKALNEYFERNNIRGDFSYGKFKGSYRGKREILGNPKVSIIIPFRDEVQVLKNCVSSILEITSYKNYEVILVDNNSKEKETSSYLESLNKIENINILKYEKEFNFSAINNFAVNFVKSEYILFLNNDTEVIEGEWLSSMLEHIQRKEVGAVGAKLLYFNDTIQHAGVVLGLGIASHPFKKYNLNSHGYAGFLDVIRNYSAVTGACLLTKKSLFLEVGGFDEVNLPIAYNDVDFCLKLRQKNYLIVYTPYSILYHYESLSRGFDEDLKFKNPEKYKRVLFERNYMENKWKEVIEKDTYYNINLTKEREDFSINLK
ncbi:MAG: glycosyltransferase [Candidatus Nomurabacteria bacterium]|nr:glycosyltransferase [Candidatus Nomurabacteria bacterium]